MSSNDTLVSTNNIDLIPKKIYKLKIVKNLVSSKKQEISTVKIQACWRGYSLRKKNNFRAL